MSIRNRLRPIAYESLPEGYTRCEYLESTGTQYIDTGFLPGGADIEVDLEICPMEVTAYTWKPFMGSSGIATGESELSSMASVGIGGNGGQLRFITVNNNWGVYDDLPPAADTIYKIHSEFNRQKNNRSIMTVNGVTKTTRNNNALNSYIGEITNTLTLFGNRSRTPNSKYKGYFASLKYDGEYVFSYIPALDPSGTPCMFDLVSRKPFYNANTAADAEPFLYKTLSYPFNPTDNWHTVNKKIKKIIGSTKYTLELVEDGN